MFIPALSIMHSLYTFGYALEHGQWISVAALESLEMFICKAKTGKNINHPYRADHALIIMEKPSEKKHYEQKK